MSVLVDTSLCYSQWFVILVAFSRISLVVVFSSSPSEKKNPKCSYCKVLYCGCVFIGSAVEQQLISIQLVSAQLCGTVVFWITVPVVRKPRSAI